MARFAFPHRAAVHRAVFFALFVAVARNGKAHRRLSFLKSADKQHFCTSKELSSGYWGKDSSWQLNSSCYFLNMESDEVRRCLEDTDFLIGGHSISRAIHFELLDYLNYTENYVDRITQKAMCELPFDDMFETQFHLYGQTTCSAAREGHASANFFWLVDWHTAALEKFYAEAIEDAEKRSRRLLISVNVMTNRCYPEFELESAQCLPLMRETFPRLIEVTQNLLRKSEKKHSFIYRTNTHVLPPRPEEAPAVAMNDYIDNNFDRSDLEHHGFALLRLGEITEGPAHVHYADHIHPDRYLTQLFLRMLIHLHCST